MRHAVVAIALFVAAAGVRAQRDAPSTGDLVELDIVALDRSGKPVDNLTAGDFRVRDEGHQVEITTFSHVNADGATPEAGRSVMLLLDDSGVPIGGTSVVQAMAERILARMRANDDVTVVRLNNDRDEPFGDRDTALQRIAGFHAGAVPFQTPATAERLLNVLATTSRQLEPIEHRRKIVVCLGAPAVCNIAEPQPPGYTPLWNPWVAALAATARANVSVYAVMPTRPGGVLFRGGGLAELTGGATFSNTESFDAFVSLLWTEASRYYLIGYWPPESHHDLRSVDVKVSRKGIDLRVRHVR